MLCLFSYMVLILNLNNFVYFLNFNPVILKHLSLSPNSQIMYQYFRGLCEAIFLLIILKSIALWNLCSMTAISWYSEFHIYFL